MRACVGFGFADGFWFGLEQSSFRFCLNVWLHSLKVRMHQNLLGGNSGGVVIDQGTGNQINTIQGNVWNKVSYAHPLPDRKSKGSVVWTFEHQLVKYARRGCSENLVYPIELIYLVGSREEWVERYEFVKYGSGSPYVHGWSVVSVGEEVLGRTVPSGCDISCYRLFHI